MRRLAYSVALVFFASGVAPLSADFLVLKKKRILVGKYQEANDASYFFKSNGEDREIPRREVARLVIGFDGIPVCFQTRRSNQPNCKGTLFLLDQVRAVLGFPQPGKNEWYMIRMRLDSLAYLEMKKSSLDPALMPVIARGVQVRVTLRDETDATGELVRARGDMLELKTYGGGRQRIERGEIQSAKILLPGRELEFIPEPPKKLRWWWFGALFTMFA